MKTPFIILTKERPKMFMAMVESIWQRTDPESYNLIICDNGSSQTEMKRILDSLEKKGVTVIRNKGNYLFEGLNSGLQKIRQSQSKYFIMSDPDIKLCADMPRDWIAMFAKILDRSNYPKVGCALDISFDLNSKYRHKIHKVEKGYWTKEMSFDWLDAPCYEAMIDTTLAMYRRDTYKCWSTGELEFGKGKGINRDGWINMEYNKKYGPLPLRVAGKYTCEHLGWWLDPQYLTDLKYYYYFSRGPEISSCLANYRNLIEEELGVRI